MFRRIEGRGRDGLRARPPRPDGARHRHAHQAGRPRRHGDEGPLSRARRQEVHQPGFADFLPHIRLLNLGGRQLGIDASRDHILATDKKDWQPVHRRIVVDEIQIPSGAFAPVRPQYRAVKAKARRGELGASPTLCLAWRARLLFEPPRQLPVARSDSAHRPPRIRVLHSLGFGPDLPGAFSRVPGQHSNFRVGHDSTLRRIHLKNL